MQQLLVGSQIKQVAIKSPHSGPINQLLNYGIHPPLSTSSVHLGNQGAFGGSVMQPAVQEQFQEGFTQQSDQNNYFSL